MSYRLRELIRRGVAPGLLHDQAMLHGGGGKGKAPPPPDYAGAAAQQAQASKEISNQQTWANRPTQNTPWGSTSWNTSAGVDPGSGQAITQWTQNETLNPNLQGALDSQISATRGRSDLAAGFQGRVQDDYSKPFDYSGLPAQQGATTQTTDAPAFAAQREQYTNAAFDQMRPEHQRQEASTRTMLANQGLTPGSAAYNTELERLGGVQAQERWNAVNQGGIEQQRMNQQMMSQQQQAFGQGGTVHQQAVAEEMQKRGMSLNEMNALMTGQQVGAPQMPSFMGAQAGQVPNYLGAATAQGQYNLNAAQMKNEGNAGLWGGLGQLAGTGAMLYGMGGR